MLDKNNKEIIIIGCLKQWYYKKDNSKTMLSDMASELRKDFNFTKPKKKLEKDEQKHHNTFV